MQQNKDGEQQFWRLSGLFSLVLLLSITSLQAGSFEQFKRTQSQNFNKYKDERDNAFNKYLKAEWKAYQVQQGVKVYEEPKPIKIPTASPKPIKSVGPKVNIKIVNEIPIKKPQEIKIVKVIQKKESSVKKIIVVHKQAEIPKKKQIKVVKKDINFDFYGTKLGFNIPNGIKNANYYPRNQKGIASFFEGAASSKYEDLIAEIQKTSKNLNLNDWAVYLLVTKISALSHPNQDNANLMSWFIFNKLGYAVKVGLANKHVILMHYSKRIIYSTPNYSFAKKTYYVIANYAKGSVGRLYSYPQDYPNSTKPLDLFLKKLPNFVNAQKYKDLSFKQNGKKYSIGFNYNQNIIDFMATYPQADYDTYFNAPLQSDTFAEIATKLKVYVDGKKMSDAMNFVLHFVQKSFKYQRDNEQFGREKVMFAQETLYYDKSDCEDRAILFSYLVKELFNISVVGVKYKDHMSTALYIPMRGDSVKAASRRFVIADPTYINSNIGQNMPKYKPKKPDSFIRVKRDEK